MPVSVPHTLHWGMNLVPQSDCSTDKLELEKYPSENYRHFSVPQILQ